jgi:hypothetical protein
VQRADPTSLEAFLDTWFSQEAQTALRALAARLHKVP